MCSKRPVQDNLRGKVLDKSTPEQIIENIKACGVVGAGGAGFPTHIKLSAKAEVVIANGSECEPLIQSDRQLMLREAEKVIKGLHYAMSATGAKRGVLAIKKKHKDIAQKMEAAISGFTGIELLLLDDFYPAGDEHVLVYEITKRTVPMGGLPVNVGVIVDNVFTLAAVFDAQNNKSFTHRYVTVTGEVKTPAVSYLPIGTKIRDAIKAVGGDITCDEYCVITGGPMMGKIEEDLDRPVTKTTNAILVLPKDAQTAELKMTSLKNAVRRSRSVCCQCNFCTEMCPRFLLGHDLTPHKTMRVFPYAQDEVNENYIYSAALCSECGLCGYYACTMGLQPNMVNGIFKNMLTENKIKPEYAKLKTDGVNMFRDERKVPVKRLIGRMGLTKYDNMLPFREVDIEPDILIIPLLQHIGNKSFPVVCKNDTVRAGQLLGAIPKEGIGANIHSPVDAKIIDISDDIIIKRV